jgi:hypothetical protein
MPSRFLFEITGQSDSPQARQARLAEAEKRNGRGRTKAGAKSESSRTQPPKKAAGRPRKP